MITILTYTVENSLKIEFPMAIIENFDINWQIFHFNFICSSDTKIKVFRIYR